jgi:flagellar basal body rod protein FlgG
LTISGEGGEIAIGEDGAVRVGGEESGRLGVVEFADRSALQKQGDQLFLAPPEAGAPQVVEAAMQVGALEMPNVSVVKGMTDLVSASRAFETLQKAVEVFGEIERRAATDIVGAR